MDGKLCRLSSKTGCWTVNEAARLWRHCVQQHMGLVKYCASVEFTLRVAEDDVGRETR